MMSYYSEKSGSEKPELNNSALTKNWQKDKKEMQGLNDRFANYIRKVQFLEKQNETLSAKLRDDRSSRVVDRYKKEIDELKIQVEELNEEKASVRATQLNLETEVKELKEKLEAEKNERMKKETKCREDVAKAEVHQVLLNIKIKSLNKELIFLKEVHYEELKELQDQIQGQEVQMDSGMHNSDLTAALREVRLQYENLVTKNKHESGDWYKIKLDGLTEVAKKNRDELRLAKDEANKYHNQVQGLQRQVKTLRETNESLENQMQQSQETLTKNLVSLQDNNSRLEEDIRNMKNTNEQLVSEKEQLLNVKMDLDAEIAYYRKLLEGVESRIAKSGVKVPPPKPAENGDDKGNEESNDEGDEDEDED